ncbi:MAG: hypothetical protein HYR88_07795 [Verrucomicrobia bacterium]|nr:hypothetical protein [Verrucomicrobiota bacterium]MBI3866892.1 hypothetical protein [Verrucomicrobiota bacterium]
MTQPTPAGGLTEFLRRLFDEGKGQVRSGPPPVIDASSRALLAEAEAIAREELIGQPPRYRPLVAEWAASLLYSACQFVVCREAPADEIVRLLKSPCPESHSPETDWSADLVLRHLPDVFRQARHLSPSDPLVRELAVLGADWPLSSVGMPLEIAPDVASFASHRCLWQLYVDRVIRREDLSRLDHPAVAESVRAALGAHPELAPKVSMRLAGKS